MKEKRIVLDMIFEPLVIPEHIRMSDDRIQVSEFLAELPINCEHKDLGKRTDELLLSKDERSYVKYNDSYVYTYNGFYECVDKIELHLVDISKPWRIAIIHDGSERIQYLDRINIINEEYNMCELL